MEVKISTQQILKILYVLSWIIFLGLCVEAGGFIFNTFFALFINPVNAQNFWEGADLSALYRHDLGYFFVVTLLMIIAALMKALLFYLIMRILHDEKLNMSHPFNQDVGRFIFNISYLSLGIGLFSHWGAQCIVWLVKQGIKMPGIEQLHFDGGGVWIFMGVTLFIIAQIFKKGIEIQSENELTI